MYYVNREQIMQPLSSIPETADALERLSEEWDGTLMQGLAQERSLHLAIESVTDAGSCLIDGFLMRDAGSYRDIIEIISEEGVIEKDLTEPLLQLVALRKPLVQEYYAWPRRELHPLTPVLGPLLRRFRNQVEQYLERES